MAMPTWKQQRCSSSGTPRPPGSTAAAGHARRAAGRPPTLRAMGRVLEMRGLHPGIITRTTETRSGTGEPWCETGGGTVAVGAAFQRGAICGRAGRALPAPPRI